MTPERFCECLDAYGADLARWPGNEVAAARALAAQATPELRERMAQAALLDAWLVGDHLAAPDDALVRRIVASAPAVRAPAAPRASWWRGWLWPAGMAGASLAGSLAGALVVSVVLRHAPPSPASDTIMHGTAFTTGAGDWSEE